MKRDDYMDVSGEEYLRAMFEHTDNGVLSIEDEDQYYPRTVLMDWDEKTLEELIRRYEELVAALTRLGQEHENWEASTQDMPRQLREVWDTYVVPYPDHGMDSKKLFELSLQEILGEAMTPEEKQLLAQREQWRQENAIKRLPYKGCEPSGLIEAARRYEKMVAIQAPKSVLSFEEVMLAEEMAYYHCQKTVTHRCCCCGRVYDLAPFGGYVYGSICPSCSWEEDGAGETEFSCANGTTLASYRQQFAAGQESV